jgi:hypothetical protein
LVTAILKAAGTQKFESTFPAQRGIDMTEKLYLTPEDEFPEDLSEVANKDLQVLDSQVQRQLDHEYVADGEPNPETEFRHYDLDEEFGERDKRKD